MYLSIIVLPFLGSLFSGFLGRKLGITGSQWISCLSLFLSALLSTVAFYEVCLLGSPVSINVGNWIDAEIMIVSWEFLFDQVSVVFCIMITYITFLILVYTVYYMDGSPHIQRFFSYLSAFAGFMLVLVTGANYFVMFVGWEGIGVVSYLLISYLYTRIQATKAALLALTMNRLGDMGLSIGFFALFALFGSVDYSAVFSIAPYFNESAITIISLLLFSGAVAKSAQLPLSTWLPGSMEAPTPVSALLHAATLVTAGIYLLLRSSPIISYSTDTLLVITLVGSLTAFVAGTTALVQNDLKRIIAFSTISQLGYMMIALGLAQWNIALLHTVLHAFFKALLFLSAGVIIHSLNDEQDIRKMGGLIRFMPFTYTVMLIGTIALLGLPWLSGFYSKDLILELAYGKYQFSGFFAFILGSLTAFFTAFYSIRLINLVYLTTPNANKSSYTNIHSEGYIVLIPLSILALFAIFLGYIGSDYVALGSDFFGNSLFYHPSNIHIIEAEFSLPIYVKLLPTILSIIGATLAFYLYHYGSSFITSLTKTIKNNIKGEELKVRISMSIYTFLNGKYNLDVLYNGYFISGGLKLGHFVFKTLDKGIIELIGPNGLTEGTYQISSNLTKLDNGIITTYALYMTLGLLSILFIIFSPIFLNSVLYVETPNILNIYSIRLLIISFFTAYIAYIS
jgi:NADH-ubiquinone oxidoreductase chain 5